MRLKLFKLLSLDLCFSMMAPMLVYAAPVQKQTVTEEAAEDIGGYDYDGVVPEEMAFPEYVVNEDTYEITDIAVENSEDTEQRTFLDYFPDPNFAQGVAKILGKNKEDFVTESELQQIKNFFPDENNITSLTGIGYLKNLETISINYSQITELPSEIGQLINLVDIFINTAGLTHLPYEFRYLTNLTQLGLNNTDLSDFPEEIFYCNKLESLSLLHSKIENIPSNIIHLINLKYILMDGGNIEYISPEIGRLQELKQLWLGGNRLTELPAEIGQLQKLELLWLGGNRLTKLPPEIGNIASLVTLSVSHNQLQEIPTEICSLPMLKNFLINYNNLISPIPLHIENFSIYESNGSVLVSQHADLSPISFHQNYDVTVEDLTSPLVQQLMSESNGNHPGYWKIFTPSRDTIILNAVDGSEISSSLFTEIGTYMVSFIWEQEHAVRHHKVNNIRSSIYVDVLPPIIQANNVTVITRYLDNILPESTAAYQVEHNASFLESFEVFEGYELYNSTLRSQPIFNVDMDNYTVGLNVVDRDYTIVLEFDKSEYKVNLITSYLDNYMPIATQSDWVRYEESYIQTYEIAEGYQIANLDQLPAGVTVDEANHTVAINSVTQGYDINLKFKKKLYDISISIVYEDGSRDDQTYDYTVPYGDRFETDFHIEKGYSIKKVSFNAAGVSVNRSRQEVTVEKVTAPVEIVIVVR